MNFNVAIIGVVAGSNKVGGFRGVGDDSAGQFLPDSFGDIDDPLLSFEGCVSEGINIFICNISSIKTILLYEINNSISAGGCSDIPTCGCLGSQSSNHQLDSFLSKTSF